MKVKIKSIFFARSESPYVKDRMYLSSMKIANNIIKRAQEFAPKDGSCEKTGFIIEWEDGEKYKDTIDLQHTSVAGIQTISEYLKTLCKLIVVTGYYKKFYNQDSVDKFKKILEDYELE